MRRLILAVLIMLGVLQPIGLAAAADPIFSNLTAAYQFADHMTFTAEIADDTPITSARLYVQSGSQPPYTIQAKPFTASTALTATAEIDLNQTRLIPFSTVSYWWEATDQTGQTARSEMQTLAYVDNRYPWQELEAGPVRVHWYQGDSGFGAAAASVAQEALPKIQQQIGVEPPAPLDIYIYAFSDDLRKAVELSGREWLGGQARPELGVVLVAIAPDDSARLNMRRDIPHELTHLMTFVATTPNYDTLPRWLDEGLATLNEGDPSARQALAVQDAAANNILLPLAKLCGAFPPEASAAVLAYGQSRAIVQQIIDAYGSAGIQALLAAYRDGATCAGGVERALNTSLGNLEAKWRSALPPGQNTAASATTSSTTTGMVPWLLLLAVIALPLIVILLWRSPRQTR